MAMILLNVSHSHSVFTISLPNSGPYCQIEAQGFYLVPTLFLRKFHFPNRSPGALIGKPWYSLKSEEGGSYCSKNSGILLKYDIFTPLSAKKDTFSMPGNKHGHPLSKGVPCIGTTHTKFYLTRVLTHEYWIMTKHFMPLRHLRGNFGQGREDCQHLVIDEFLCMVTGCALGTDVCHWMFN